MAWGTDRPFWRRNVEGDVRAGGSGGAGVDHMGLSPGTGATCRALDATVVGAASRSAAYDPGVRTFGCSVRARQPHQSRGRAPDGCGREDLGARTSARERYAGG